MPYIGIWTYMLQYCIYITYNSYIGIFHHILPFCHMLMYLLNNQFYVNISKSFKNIFPSGVYVISNSSLVLFSLFYCQVRYYTYVSYTFPFSFYLYTIVHFFHPYATSFGRNENIYQRKTKSHRKGKPSLVVNLEIFRNNRRKKFY